MRQVHGRGPEVVERRVRVEVRDLRAVDVRVLLDLARDVRLVVVARALEETGAVEKMLLPLLYILTMQIRCKAQNQIRRTILRRIFRCKF